MSTSAMGTKLTKKANPDIQGDLDWLIGSLLSIGGVSVDTEEREITTLDSPDGAKEFEPGAKTPGDVPFKIMVKKTTDNATITKVLGLLASGTTEAWEVEYPSGAKWNFDGYVKGYEAGEITTDGNIEFTTTIKVSGLPTFTPGA